MHNVILMFISPWLENDCNISVDQADKHCPNLLPGPKNLKFTCGIDNHYWSRRASSRADRILSDVRGKVSADISGTVSSIAPAQAARCAE